MWLVILRLSALTWVLLLGLGCPGRLSPTAGPPAEGPGVPKQLQARQIIVTLPPASPERWAQLAATLAQAYDLPQVGTFPLTVLGIQCVVFQVPADRSLDEVLARLAADPRVDAVQRNQQFQGLAAVHNDPYAPLQYGAQLIRADLAHRWATGKGVHVAVIDTGVETGHPDLRGQIGLTATFVEGGEQTFDQDHHGTAVAGVIAARADNGLGTFGIAPGVTLTALKACAPPTPSAAEALCSSWSLQRAVNAAIEGRVQLLNLSLAGPPDPLLARLLGTAEQRGITVVAAALEVGPTAPGFPASLETVIAVRASDPQGRVHSALGGKRAPLLVAPGMQIVTTVPRGAYNFLDGSSLAAAHVTGLAALLLERDPRLAPRQVRELLGANPGPANPAGVVDACRALTKLLGRRTCP